MDLKLGAFIVSLIGASAIVFFGLISVDIRGELGCSCKSVIFNNLWSFIIDIINSPHSIR